VTGKIINPHNPDFITKKPWYLGQEGGPSLQHQTAQIDKTARELTLAESDALYAQKAAQLKAVKLQSATERVVVFRKGACANCGAMTHQKKDCVERPRSMKKSALYTGLDIAADDVTLSLQAHGKVSYSAKRDAWQGYDADEYKETISKFDRIEAQRIIGVAEKKKTERLAFLKNRQERKDQRKADKGKIREDRRLKLASGVQEGDTVGDGDLGDSDSSTDDEDEQEGEDDVTDLKEQDQDATQFQARMARQGGVGGAQMMVTARNLRIREDTPKYLRNLDMDSAHYDPKSRSMRANPNPELNPEEQTFAGDNFQRYTGDALKLAEQQILSWEMQQRGEGIDAIANPSQMELAAREYKEKRTALDMEKKKALASKYGNAATTVRRVMTVAMPPPAAAASTTSSNGSSSGSSSSSAGAAATVVETRELDPRLRFGQSETYQEYNPDGTVVRAKVVKASSLSAVPVVEVRHSGKTHYAEDVYDNNHTSVWGSYYNRTRGEWGFACCWQCLRSSYCTGEAGKRAIKASLYQTIDVAREKKKMESVHSADASANATAAGTTSGAAKASTGFTRRSDVYGEGPKDVQLDEEKMKAALARAEAYQAAVLAAATDGTSAITSSTGKRKNRYNGDKDAADAQDPALQSKVLSAGGLGNAGRGGKTGNDGQGNREDSGSVSVEDMEVFRLKRLKQEDPMAALLDSEELLEYK
jgi:pre-mRNA-processing factor SLU7